MSNNIYTDIQAAAKQLMSGNVIAIPTETVYGLAANALDEKAIEKIFLLKQRPKNNPLIVHTFDKEEMKKFVTKIPLQIEKLINVFCPGAITFLLPKKNIISNVVTANSPLVAIRIPNHPTTLSLLKLLPFPLAAPSANRFTYVSPTKASDINIAMQCAIDFILDGGECRVGIESTIVEWKNNALVIHRHGAISLENLQQQLPDEKIISANNQKTQIQIPGNFLNHYAPKTPLFIGEIETLIAANLNAQMAVIGFEKTFQKKYPNNIKFEKVLSLENNFEEIAQKLYATLLEIDQLKLDLIICGMLEEKGIGKAINDRLKKAAHQNQKL